MFEPIFINVIVPLVVLLGIVVYFFSSRLKSSFYHSNDYEIDVLEIQVPKDDEGVISDTNLSALSAEHLFASLHGLLKEDNNSQEHFSFEVSANNLGVKFYYTAPVPILKFVESQIYAQYPKAQLRRVSDYAAPEKLDGKNYEVASFSLKKEHFFPIKTFRDFEVDPLTNIISTLSEVRENEGLWLQFLIRPIADGWQADGHKYVALLTETGSGSSSGSFLGGFFNGLISEFAKILISIPSAFFSNAESQASSTYGATAPVRLTASQELEVSSIENKLSRMGYNVVVRVVSHSVDQERVDSNLRAVAASFKQFTNPNSNEFMLTNSSNKLDDLEKYKKRSLDIANTMVLNNEELATVFHLPLSRAKTPSVSWVFSKMGEPPSNLPVDDCTYIGETLYRGKKTRFGLNNGDDRLRHMYLIGKTGTGKSTLLETMVTQDIISGNGVGVLDPHGETIDHILEKIPDDRVDDVVLFDPSDFERPIGLNLLEMDHPEQKNLMASALVSAIKQHFDYSWGPRLEYLLNYALLTLLDVPGTSMLGITRLLEDTNYQNYILEHVTDPVVKRFWEKEYKDMKGNQKLVTEAIAPIQNKVNRFLASTTIRNILGQKHSTIDLWDIMQEGKILLINLSKGKIGADNANLLGALLVSRIQFMALQRAHIPYEKRRPFYLYVDEFQNFATGSFEEVLSESRKYKLGLYLTHQYTAQLPEELLEAVYGNVGTIASFSLGAPDARSLSSEFAPYFDEEDIISLDRFHIYIKLMINGMTSLPFSARILLPWEKESSLVPTTTNKERAIEASRQKYGSDRAHVEYIIKRWVERPFDKGMAIAEKIKKEREGKNG